MDFNGQQSLPKDSNKEQSSLLIPLDPCLFSCWKSRPKGSRREYVCSHTQVSQEGMLPPSANECRPPGGTNPSENSFIPDSRHWITVLAQVMFIKSVGTRPERECLLKPVAKLQRVPGEEPDAELWYRTAGREHQGLVSERTLSHSLIQGPGQPDCSPAGLHGSFLTQVQPVTTWAEMVAWLYDRTENWTPSSEIPDSALKPCCATHDAAYNETWLWFDWLKLHHSLGKEVILYKEIRLLYHGLRT